MAAYYNEFDPFAAAWLRNLIAAGLLPDGDVDERDIREVDPDELRGYTQWHYFAGIGGWPYALRLAGWRDDWPVLTGSPPCQPFSYAGRRRGVADERHLSPVWLEHIRQLRPPVLFGEQVAGAVTLHDWLDDLLDALELEGYAAGAVVLPACSVGAPHLRQRLWIVADRLGDADGAGLAERTHVGGDARQKRQTLERAGRIARGVADADRRGRARQRQSRGRDAETAGGGAPSVLADAERKQRQRRRTGEAIPESGALQRAERCRDARHVADAAGGQLPQPGRGPEARDGAGSAGAQHPGDGSRAHHGGWDAADWLLCRDEVWRPVEPGTFPLAHGVPARVGRLRAYGNAIVPQVAAEVVKAWMEVRGIEPGSSPTKARKEEPHA